jgi:hypothetical protein
VIYSAIFILAQAKKFVKPTWRGKALAGNFLFNFNEPYCHQQKYCNPPPLLRHKQILKNLISS